MKTVVHIIEQLSDFGGTPRMLLYLAAHNDHDRNRLIFATYRDSSLRAEFEKHNATVINLGTMSVIRLVWKILRLLRTTGADVICTHFTRPLIAGFIVSRITGVPFIHAEHSSAHYRTGVARRLAQICMPFAQAVICNSNYTAKTIADIYAVKPSRMRVIYNPVEPRQQRSDRDTVRMQMSIEPDGLVIGHVGGMITTRDQSTLVKAFHAIHKQYPQARLWLIGDGPVRGALERLVGELHITGQVSFLGYTGHVGDFLGGMDIYVNPTIDEGFGIAVVEAMFAGLPVILAEAGAHPELINDGEQGLFYPPGDSATLSAKLKLLIDNPEYRRQLGHAGRDSARRRFFPHHCVQEYAHVIDAVASGSIPEEFRAQRQVD